MPNLFPGVQFNDGYVNHLLEGLNFEIGASPLLDDESIEIYQCINDDCISLKLMNDTDIRESVIIAHKLTIKGKDYWSVKCTHTHPDYRGKRNMIKLYRILIEQLKIKVVSDSIQSIPGTYNLWKRLIDISEETIRFSILDVTTGKKSKLTSLKESKIWGFDLDVINYEDLDQVTEQYLAGEIEKVLLQFITNNPNKIGDRSHILLMAERK